MGLGTNEEYQEGNTIFFHQNKAAGTILPPLYSSVKLYGQTETGDSEVAVKEGLQCLLTIDGVILDLSLRSNISAP